MATGRDGGGNKKNIKSDEKKVRERKGGEHVGRSLAGLQLVFGVGKGGGGGRGGRCNSCRSQQQACTSLLGLHVPPNC